MSQLLNFKNLSWLTIWAATLYGALSITNIRGDWGQFLCGPWGCGPPAQALVSCHLAWLVAIVPAALLVRSMRTISGASIRLLGLACLAIGLLSIGVAIVEQWITWRPNVSDWQRDFFWQRCGLVIVTRVDVPMLQLLVGGMILVWRGRKRKLLPPHESASSNEVEEVRSR